MQKSSFAKRKRYHVSFFLINDFSKERRIDEVHIQKLQCFKKLISESSTNNSCPICLLDALAMLWTSRRVCMSQCKFIIRLT